MFKYATATAIALSVGAAASAGMLTEDRIDLSGQPIPGIDSGMNVITYEQTTSFPLASINFALNVTTFSPSWGSEIIIQIAHESGFSITADGSDDNFADTGPADLVFGWDDSSGTFLFTGDFVVDEAFDTSGTWTITVFDEFDDFVPEPDAVFNDGSSITIKKIPAPGAAALFGVAGLVGIRRRR